MVDNLDAKDYPFLKFIEEDKSKYKTATEAGYVDPDNLFLIGDSGGFLMNIDLKYKFVNTELFYEVGNYYRRYKRYCEYKVDSIPHRQFRKREEYRRTKGFSAPCLLCPDGTIKEVRITGSHYNFLNILEWSNLTKVLLNEVILILLKKFMIFLNLLIANFGCFTVWSLQKIMDFI